MTSQAPIPLEDPKQPAALTEPGQHRFIAPAIEFYCATCRTTHTRHTPRLLALVFLGVDEAAALIEELTTCEAGTTGQVLKVTTKQKKQIFDLVNFVVKDLKGFESIEECKAEFQHRYGADDPEYSVTDLTRADAEDYIMLLRQMVERLARLNADITGELAIKASELGCFVWQTTNEDKSMPWNK